MCIFVPIYTVRLGSCDLTNYTVHSPDCSDLSAPIHNLVTVAMQDTLYVQWDHDYYLCRNFTIYLNGTAVPECTNISALNCTIQRIEADVQYELTVVSTELGTKNSTVSRMITTDPIMLDHVAAGM